MGKRTLIAIAASYIGGERSELLDFLYPVNNMAGTTCKTAQSTMVRMVLTSPEVHLNYNHHTNGLPLTNGYQTDV